MKPTEMKGLSATELKECSIKDLTAYYNAIAEHLGEKTIAKFKDKTTAIRRIGAIRGMAAAYSAAEKKNKKPEAKKPEAKKPATKKASKSSSKASKPAKKQSTKPKASKKSTAKSGATGRGRGAKPNYFRNVAEVIKPPREREGKPSLRKQAFDLLCVGTTADDLEKLVNKHHRENGLSDPKIDSRLRALELIRLLNYQNGYGFYEDADGLVYLTDSQKDVDKAKKAYDKANPSDDVL